MHGGSKREDGSAKPTLPVSFPFPPRQPSIASTARHVRSTHGRSYKRHELAVSSKAYGNLEHKIPRSPGQASEQAAAGLIASLTSAENAHGRPQSMRSRSNDGRPRCGPSFNVTGERPPSSARPRSRSPRNAPSATPPQVEESQQPIYVVGNAIVNPFVPISPSVQPGVRGVPSLLTLPDAALRASAGVSITPSLCTPRDAMGNEMDGTTKSAPLPPPLNLDGATSSVTSATPQQFGKDFVFCPTNADMLPRDRLADPVPGTILYVEALSSARKRSCSISTPVAPSPEKSSRAGVDALKALYNTTEDDVVDVDAEKECVAREVLSVLDHAEQRSRELAAARRHIDWDVTIPTAETIPPPAIAFLDGNGAPLPHIDVIHFTLDTANLQLQRDGEAEIARTPIAAPLSGRDRPPSSATGRVARAAAGMGGGIAEAAQSIGRMVSYDQSQGEHRIHRLVGLMGGLAEKVGLERVMEYQVHSPMPDMFIRAPYVDSDSGDLVLRMNPSLQGKLNLQITGFDCGSVDPSTGCVQTSSNSLQCAIRILYSGSGKKDPLQMVPPADPASTGREEEPSSFVFPATNPHELRYEECEGTATMYLLEHARAKRKEAEKERAEVQRVHANSNENRRWSRRHMLDDAEESQSGPTKSTGGLALDVNALNAAEDAPAAAPAGHTDDRVGKATPTPSVDLLDGLRGTESLREPVLSPFAYFVGMLQSPLSHLRLTAWQDRVNDLLDGTDEEVLQQPDRRAEFMHQVRRDLDQMLGGPNRSSGPLTAEKMNTLRCYILCLLLEDDRSGKQQYYDVIELCKVLTHGALLRTISTTSGTPEGLQKAAAAVLSQSPNAMNGMRGDAAVLGQRGAVLSEKEKKNLRLLEDALNVSMTAMHSIGAWSNAVAYATQRVHALCVLEKDTTILVSSAQRDLSELCYFFGDYGASAAVAADVLMLTEQLYDVDSAEQAEAELLLSLACLAGGEDGRGRELLTKVGGYIDRAERSFPRALRVQLRLVLSLVHEAYGVRPSKAGGATNVAGAAPVPSPAVLLDEAVGLLAEEFDVDRLTSPPPTGGADARLERTTRRTSSGKRLRWNLLSFAASLLIGRGEVVRGIATMQDVMQELVLGTHPFIESSHRAELSVMLWIGFSTWKIRSYPLDREETLPVLRDFVQRITQIKGPLHPIAARANLGLAECLECIPHSHALGIATKSLAELQRCLCCRSNYLAMAHRLCSRLYSIAQRWKPALDHANAALVIAQVNGFREEYMCDYEGRFVGALLRCPTSANVKLNTDLLITRLQERIAEMEAVYGVQADRLAVPLATLADAYYLLHNYDGALSCLQRAIRTADPKGVLFVTNTVLRPACFLSSTEEVQRRDETVNSVLTTKESLFLLAQLLFSMAAVLEAKGEAEDAQDCYGRCLALFECIGLGGCLSAIRVCGVMAKLQFTAGAFGDALGWARRARKAVHARYQNWPQEETATKVLVNVVEHRINEEERTYVTVNTHAPYSDFVELI